MRPTTLDEVVGQQHIVGKDKLLYRAIKADKLSSIIFYRRRHQEYFAKSPYTTSTGFMQINTTLYRPKDMEESCGQAEDNQGMYQKRRCTFYRSRSYPSTKAAGLSASRLWRDGTIILIGATTKNPYFE